MTDDDEIQANKNGQNRTKCCLIPRRGMLQLLVDRYNSKLFGENLQPPHPALAMAPLTQSIF